MYAMKMQMAAGTKRGRKKAPWPQLMEEIMLEILLRLPAKSLLRFRSVCKAWRAMIDEPMFIRDHLRHSASKSQCFIISPHTLDVRFYQWQLQQNNNVATFLDSKDFPGQCGELRHLIHCDGLVFVPTESNLYLFNPATRDAVTLPKSPRVSDNLSRATCYCQGLGLDPCTGKYKVVRAFSRSQDPDTGMGTDMGMEVFTVAGGDDDGGGGSWREIASNPPYPAETLQAATAVGGFMFWRLAERQLERELRGILHLSLEEEEFGVTGLPNDWNPDDEFTLDVLRGRDLCLTSGNSVETTMNIWTLPVADEGLATLWRWQYSIQLSDLCHAMLLPGVCHTMALPPVSNGIILSQEDTVYCYDMALPPVSDGIILSQEDTVYCYDLATSKLRVLCKFSRLRYQRGRKWKKHIDFDVKPFTESLIRIT